MQQVRGTQIRDASIQRADIDTVTVGQALPTRVIGGSNVTLSSTGANTGTGDVTVNASFGKGSLAAQDFASGGTGSAGSPFTSATGTGGLVEAINASITASGSRSATIRLGDAEYRVTSLQTIAPTRLSIIGTEAAWADDPNAEARPISGSIIGLSGTSFPLAGIYINTSSGSGFTIRGVIFWGVSRNPAQTYPTNYNLGISAQQRMDKAVLDRLFFGNCYIGLSLHGAGMQADVWTVKDSGFIGNWYGILLETSMVSIMSNWTRLVIADNDGPGLYCSYGTGSDAYMYRNKISGCNFVRNCRGVTASGGNAQLQIYGEGNIVTMNDFSEAGHSPTSGSVTYYNDVGTVVAADTQQANIDDIRVHGPDNQIYGNQFYLHNSSGGSVIHVYPDATNTTIGPNMWVSSNYNQIVIDAGATDTTIYMSPGLLRSKIVDNGTRTNYVGDADTAFAVASEALAAGAWVNLYLNAGVLKARNANATSSSPLLDVTGFVRAAVSSGATAIVILNGTNYAVTGQTLGRVYLSTTPGAGQSTAPTGSGNGIQWVGTSLTATSVRFQPNQITFLA